MNINDLLKNAKNAANQHSAELDKQKECQRINDFYIRGENAEKSGDYTKAIEYYTEAANSGHVMAMNRMAHIYSDNGKLKNYVLAFKLFKKSAENGNVNSQANLGWCYHYGHGTIVNLKEAVRWYETANDDYSKKGIVKIKNSKEWKEIVANEAEKKVTPEDHQYMCQLGMWFQHGENGFPTDIDKAIYWFQKAAMAGNAAALTFLNMASDRKKAQEQEDADRRRMAEEERQREYERQRRAEDEKRRQKEQAEAEQRRAEDERRRQEQAEQERREEEQRREREYEQRMAELEWQQRNADPEINVRINYEYQVGSLYPEEGWITKEMKRSTYLALLSGGQANLRAYVRNARVFGPSTQIYNVTIEELDW